ncbi:MAG: rhomboid family intramembrane serine protease [Chloroflexi bacterium]|nr:rhomboid family intramembrane serine protease [Chloroflexota bacterium]
MFPIRDLSPSRGTALVTILLIVLNIVAFFGWQPHGDHDAELDFLYRRAAVACEVTRFAPISIVDLREGECVPDQAPALFPEKQVALSVVVSMFLHGGLLHLLGNMWFLWIFGDNIEEAFGHLGYALMYLVTGVGATLVFSVLHMDSVDPLIGASGAIAGVLGAYLVLFPKGWVLALWFVWVVPVPAVLFLGLWFVGQFNVVTEGVAWEAHVAGFVIGAGIALLFRRPLLRRTRPPSRELPRTFRAG